jgi:hypothetical protein
LVRFGKPALAATVVALLLGRDVHMQIKAGIERAIAAFLEEAPKAPRHCVRAAKEAAATSSRFVPITLPAVKAS